MAFRKKTPAPTAPDETSQPPATLAQLQPAEDADTLEQQSAPLEREIVYPDLTSPHARGIVRKSEALKWL